MKGEHYVQKSCHIRNSPRGSVFRTVRSIFRDQACPYWVKLVISHGYRLSERFIWRCLFYHVIPPAIAQISGFYRKSSKFGPDTANKGDLKSKRLTKIIRYTEKMACTGCIVLT